MSQPNAPSVLRSLRAHSRPRKAQMAHAFFQCGPGGYGNPNDRFLGLTVPEVRAVARQYRDLPHAQVERLFRSPVHEARLCALVIWCQRYPRVDAAEQARIHRAYLRLRAHLDNWDLVDASAPTLAGAHFELRSRLPLYRLARSRRLWDRRIAIVATHWFIRQGDLDDTFALAEALLGDHHHLMHKATGWMLREAGKKDEAALLRFLDRHAARMPRTMLRYSLERLTPSLRRRYMSRKGAAP